MDSAGRIKKLAGIVPVQSYLEIGVSYGVTFNALEFPYKAAVDPQFNFDWRKLHVPGKVEFFPTTSDAFFTSFGARKQFDLVFIDGLHTFAQTLRDLNNALMLSHENTVFVIDDIMPNDVFSALETQQRAIAERKRAIPASIDPSWHGDVYKLVLYVHDFMPMLSYATTPWSDGNPQMICWRRPRGDFKPRFQSIEQIERLTWFDIPKWQELFKVKPEQAIFEQVARALSPIAPPPVPRAG